MSTLSLSGVKIVGVSACVPPSIDEVRKYPLFSEDEADNFISSTGIARKRMVDQDTCTSDLSLKAAEQLIQELGWEKNDIEALVFVTQTPDYDLPATSCILQDRLGIPSSCFTLDISLGCSGWVYGLSVLTSLMAHGTIRKGLLLAGDTPSKACSTKDKSAYPLFGDAATATAVEYTGKETDRMDFVFNTDGSGYKAIIIEEGAYRNQVTPSSFESHVIEPGIERNGMQLVLDGMDVFAFGISKAPSSVRSLLEFSGKRAEEIDYFLFHQANKFMNEKIRKKLKLPAEKVPYSLENFGNTSSASIPITMITELRDELRAKHLRHVACGFGVGLSWASVYFETDGIVCPSLIEY